MWTNKITYDNESNCYELTCPLCGRTVDPADYNVPDCEHIVYAYDTVNFQPIYCDPEWEKMIAGLLLKYPDDVEDFMEYVEDNYEPEDEEDFSEFGPRKRKRIASDYVDQYIEERGVTVDTLFELLKKAGKKSIVKKGVIAVDLDEGSGGASTYVFYSKKKPDIRLNNIDFFVRMQVTADLESNDDYGAEEFDWNGCGDAPDEYEGTLTVSFKEKNYSPYRTGGEEADWKLSPGLMITIEEGIIRKIEKTMDLWCHGDSGPGDVDPKEYWSREDEIKAVSFLKKITK